MPAYKELFPVGSSVRVTAPDRLDEFHRTWRFHHPLAGEQLAFAGRQAIVRRVSFYHGGDVLYELERVPGVWHEACLEANYAAAWRRYRLLNWLGLVALLVFISALPLSIMLDQFSSLAPISKTVFIAVATVGLISIWFLLLLIGSWRCPRCGQCYARARRSMSGWTLPGRRCVHCGLVLYSDAGRAA